MNTRIEINIILIGSKMERIKFENDCQEEIEKSAFYFDLDLNTESTSNSFSHAGFKFTLCLSK